MVRHEITTPKGTIVQERWRPIPYHLWEKVQQELRKMLATGIIVPWRNTWQSPMVIVPKNDGMLQICIDFRKVNEIARFDVFPMPHVEELLEQIGQPRYMSTIDMAKGYWQIPMALRDRQKMVFEFIRMLFSLHGAVALFQ